MRKPRGPLTSATGLLAALVSTVACGCSADPTTEATSVPIDQVSSRIVGGRAVAAGSWPMVAWLDNGCTGLLIAPDLVAFAAHCGPHATELWLGDAFEVVVDDAAGTARVFEGAEGERFEVKECAVHPDGGLASGTDIGWCRLAQRALDPTLIVPPLLGCAHDGLAPGANVTLVGFGGIAADSPVGTKRAVQADVLRVGTELQIGSEDRGTCAGDSGSPAFVQLGSATAPEWQVAGLLSSGVANDGCGVGYYTDLQRVVEWLEESSGSDLTPCHNSAQHWDASGDCIRASIGAAGEPLSQVPDFSSVCGAAHVAELAAGGGGCAVSGRRTQAPLATLLLTCCLAARRYAGALRRGRTIRKPWRKR